MNLTRFMLNTSQGDIKWHTVSEESSQILKVTGYWQWGVIVIQYCLNCALHGLICWIRFIWTRETGYYLKNVLSFLFMWCAGVYMWYDVCVRVFLCAQASEYASGTHGPVSEGFWVNKETELEVRCHPVLLSIIASKQRVSLLHLFFNCFYKLCETFIQYIFIIFNSNSSS